MSTSGVSRRTLLKWTGAGLAAATAGGAATARPHVAGAQSHDFPSKGQPYAGTALNVAMVAEPKPLALKQLIPEFEQQTGIKVNFEDLAYSTLQEKQLTAITQGSGAYDIVHIDCVWMGQYAGQGWLAPVDDLAKRTDPAALDLEDFVPKLLSELSEWDGQLYGLPFDTSIMMFYYRTDLLKQHGVELPQTWEQVHAAAQKITDAEKANDVYGLTLMAKRGVQLGCTYGCLLGANGGYYYDDAYKATLSAAPAVTALQDLVGLVQVANPGSLAQDYDEGDATFAGGGAAMFVQWNDSIPRYNNPEESKIVGNWAAAVMPGVNQSDGSILRTPTIGGWNTGILSDSPHKEAAWEFLLWATSKDMERRLADAQPPARASALSDPELVKRFPEYAPMLESLNLAWGRPRIKVWSQMADTIDAALSEAVTQQQTPADALAEANTAVDQILFEGGFQK